MGKDQPSFEKINYSLRIAKNIERKMIVESLPGLKEFLPINNYSYIGFGSPYFTDFILFHKQLGITDLISIEKEYEKKERFEFNKPFNSIKMIFKESTLALQDDIDHQKNKIIWLDYDYKLDTSVLIDIEYISKKSISGDVLLVTLNANSSESLPNIESIQKRNNVLNKFKEKLSNMDENGEILDFSRYIDASITPSDIEGWGYSKECKKVIDNLIQETLRRREEALGIDMRYKLIYNFNYTDGAHMLTIGYIFYESCDEVKYTNCKFDNFDFCKEENQPYMISAPKLTMKELHLIDYYLPNNTASLPELKLNPEDLEMYKKVYRYYPSFIEAVR
ncbi:MAG: hypothetical protein PHG81_06145 [Aliarcobacter sp.]|nr:hypothetical protein [Aliarcobacter sp.]